MLAQDPAEVIINYASSRENGNGPVCVCDLMRAHLCTTSHGHLIQAKMLTG